MTDCQWCYWDKRIIGQGYEFLHGRNPIEPGPKWNEVCESMRRAAARADKCVCRD